MSTEKNDKIVFWGCFIALITTAFAFIRRAFPVNIPDLWPAQFGLDKVQAQELFGAGIWPFAISIIVFSLIIDYIGYKTTAFIAMGCHIASLLLTLFAKTPEALYWSVFLIAIANGMVEAFINPVVATAFSSPGRRPWSATSVSRGSSFARAAQILPASCGEPK